MNGFATECNGSAALNCTLCMCSLHIRTVESGMKCSRVRWGPVCPPNGLQCHCSQVFTCICCICCQGQGWSLKTNGSAVHHRKVHEHVHVLQFRNSTLYCNGPAMARTLHQKSAADAVKCCCNWRDAPIVVTLGGLAF